MNQPVHPLLTLWRSVPQREFAGRVRDVLALLVELTHFTDEGDQALVREAIEPDFRGQGACEFAIASKLALRVLRETDLCMSWVAVSAVRASTPALVVLLHALGEIDRDPLAPRPRVVAALRTRRLA